jgi:XTP/dITP diphosphohydrolase
MKMNILVFATHNQHKVKEVSTMLSNLVNVVDLEHLMFFEDIPETGNTLKDNALQKATFVNKKTGLNCLADDTGLVVDALNGEPGIYSARYAGEGANSEKNIDKLLLKLKNQKNRNAHFKCVIALIFNDKNYFFEGMINGKITAERIGNYGFGYDSVFMPDGYNKTFAELSADEKNVISHRGLAIKQLVDFFNKNF